MNSNRLVFLRIFVLIFSFVLIAPTNSLAAKFAFEGNEKNEKSTRPRVVADEAEKKKQEESVSPKAVVAYELERRVFELVNQKRTAAGLPELVWSDDVAKIARIHSENMANLKFFSHTGADGLTVNDRADLFGISKWRSIGENIAFNKGYENPAEFAVERWMKSPGHRENILNASWKESAIGVAVTPDGEYYFTEVFLSRK